MAKLTVLQLKSLQPKDAGTKVRDDGGLIGTVRSRGDSVSVHFDWRYRFGGKVRQIAIGTFPKDSLADIRSSRDRARHLLDEGKDPIEELRAAKIKAAADQVEAIATEQARLQRLAIEQSRITVTALFERWVTTDLVRRKDGGREIRRMFQKDVLPKIGALAVEDVRKGHVTTVTDALLAREVPRMAKLIFSLMRQMFRFAVDRDVIEFDPTSSIRKAKIGGKDVERERILSATEVKDLCAKLPQAHLIPTTEIAIWLCLSTTCRISELLRAKWGEIDFDKREWRIPADNSKNGRPHIVYLSDFAARKFNELYEIQQARYGFTANVNEQLNCYPNRRGDGPVSVKTITKQVGDRQRGDRAPMSHRSPHKSALLLSGGRWTPHDLRRTGATMMTSLGVMPKVAECCLNHVEENRMARIYQRYQYEAEMREAWRLLGERLDLLTNLDAANVIPIKGRTSAGTT